jgi:glycosyltransferase involved in cell wall biosynthesis
VYLTYPFVLSWSLLEAMSAGCAIVASDTAPVREVIKHNEMGLLVDFFDVSAIAEQVSFLIKNPKERQRFGESAREFVLQKYHLERVCLPRQIALVSNSEITHFQM